MTRPPLTDALRSVLSASVDGARRPGLLTVLQGRTEEPASERHLAPVADVIPLPRVIPMPRRAADALIEDPDYDPTAA